MTRTSGDLSGVIRPVTELSQAVFLSYASQDAEAAQKICEALRAASIAVFFDQSELRGGDVWDQKIRREIHECTLFIPVISANTASRHEGYFRLEWDLADQRTHMMARSRVFVVPVCLDSTTQVAADVPESFQRAQWTRMLGGDAPPAFVERIKRLLSPEPSEPKGAGVAALTTIQKPLGRFSRSRVLLVGVVAVVIVAFGYLVAKQLVLSRRAAEVAAAPAPAAQSAPATAFNPPPHSIAVLPFVNLSGNKEQDYFSDGLSEELLNSLSRLNDLQVVARTSSFSFKGQSVDISTIAHKLNVGAVLEGSVRPVGHTVRITVQLINALNGFHIWSQTYDRRFSDILKVQTEVATSVAEELRGKLIGDQKAKLKLGGTDNPEAHDAYLRGTQEPDRSLALAAYDRAIAIDPDYAAAYVGKSSALLDRMISPSNLEERRHSQEQALATAQHAVAVAPDYGDAHAILAEILYFSLDFYGAAREYDRALAVAPGGVFVLATYARFALVLGHFDAALAAAQKAVGLDPLDSSSYVELAHALYFARRFAEVEAPLRKAQALSPRSTEVENRRIQALLRLGEFDQARQRCESVATPLDEDTRHRCLASAYRPLGRQADAERELKAYQALDKDTEAVSYARVYAQWGNKPMALLWLAKAEQLLDPRLIYIKVDPELDPVRDEPEFRGILARLNFPP